MEQVQVVCSDEPLPNTSNPMEITVDHDATLSTMAYEPFNLVAVIPLAWTRADVDKSYTKLDLMNEKAVDEFFQTMLVDGMFCHLLDIDDC